MSITTQTASLSGPSGLPTSCFIEAGFALVFRIEPEPSSPQAFLPEDPSVVRANVARRTERATWAWKRPEPWIYSVSPVIY